MPRIDRRSLLAAMLILPVSQVLAKPTMIKTEMAVFATPSQTHRLDRNFITGNANRRYQIFRAIPKKAPPKNGFPVLYMLDGNAAFDSLTLDLLAAAPDLVIIGVGYDTPLRFAVDERSVDYTPPAPDGGPVPDPDRPEREIGGASQFLDFLTGELRNSAEANLPIDTARRAIWGHSYGGLFSLYALATHAQSFTGYAAASPSLWREEFPLHARLEQLQIADGVKRDIFITAGDNEKQRGSTQATSNGLAPATSDLIAMLNARTIFNVHAHIFKGLSHGETFAASIPLVLDWCMKI